MKANIFQVSLLVGSIFAVSSTVHAEEVAIQPLAIESYSKDFNVSTQEAERRLKIESQLDYILDGLDDQFGESIASVYFDNGQDFKLVVRTTKKGNTERKVIDLTNQLSKEYSLPIEVVGNAPRNFKSIQNIIENQGSRISKLYESFQTIGYDPQNDSIYISFYEPDTTRQEKIKSSLKKISGMDTTIKFLAEPIALTAGESGGGLIDYTLDDICTGGFTGTMNGQLGILTATHCVLNKTTTTYNNNYYAPVSVGTHITPETTSHEISFLPLKTTSIVGSVQQYVPEGTSSTNVYTSNLPITGIGYAQGEKIINNQKVGGTYLCHTGQKTGYSCGRVVSVISSAGTCNSASLNKTTRASCGATFLLVTGPSFKITGGDSGGPLFDPSGKAYGIASAGGMDTDGSGRYSGFFSSLAYLSGFTLKTGG